MKTEFVCFFQSKRLGDTFEASWKVFTNKYPISLHNFGKKRICFSEVVFSLLPRMAGGGLYYSTYVVIIGYVIFCIFDKLGCGDETGRIAQWRCFLGSVLPRRKAAEMDLPLVRRFGVIPRAQRFDYWLLRFLGCSVCEKLIL